MDITADDVRALLDSELPEASLVLQEGRVRLLSGEDLRSPAHAGALVVATRETLHGQLGDRDRSRRELDEVAAGLQAGVTNQGG
ncbi:hypothetical protein [Saccharomonospora iraqiensis]|uniref:hypothetical protein n=1 Tax=Saccharomonospora iraqiensis TaxID=52698 RepID=UPI00022E0E72|nr:hypothetical protein [Saccharomonospora iraqiensis]